MNDIDDMTDEEILEAANGGIDKATGRKYYRDRDGDKVFDTYKKVNRIGIIIVGAVAMLGGLLMSLPPSDGYRQGSFGAGFMIFGFPAFMIWLAVWGLYSLRQADSWQAGLNREKIIRNRIEDRPTPRPKPIESDDSYPL